MIIREINAWRQSITVSSEKYSTHIQQCAKVQLNIGWKNFLEGLIGENIIDQQQKYYSLMIDATIFINILRDNLV